MTTQMAECAAVAYFHRLSHGERANPRTKRFEEAQSLKGVVVVPRLEVRVVRFIPPSLSGRLVHPSAWVLDGNSTRSHQDGWIPGGEDQSLEPYPWQVRIPRRLLGAEFYRADR